MLPFVIAGGIVVILIAALASETEKKPSEFNNEDIIEEFGKFFEPTEETKAKIHATKLINKLIKGMVEFKLGKSGSPKDRIKQHTKFEKIYIIIESDDKKFIEKLEGVYNKKYISNAKNKNCKIGSAGEMTEKTGRYFLYFVANEKTKKSKKK